jgi:hypothetical protein
MAEENFGKKKENRREGSGEKPQKAVEAVEKPTEEKAITEELPPSDEGGKTKKEEKSDKKEGCEEEGGKGTES